MSNTTPCTTIETPDVVTLASGASDPWQLLAAAVDGRDLNPSQLEVTRAVPVATALTVLFPELDDAARQEFLWAIGG
ncbi:MAG: hypothetical protein ABIR68_10380 [Ilumatobacteraceae bacterium]